MDESTSQGPEIKIFQTDPNLWQIHNQFAKILKFRADGGGEATALWRIHGYNLNDFIVQNVLYLIVFPLSPSSYIS